MDYFRKSWAKVRTALASMPPSQRYSVMALLGVVAISLVMLVTWGGREEYVPIISDLSGAQMTAIQSALKDSGIKYKFGDGMLLVPPGDKDRVWMALSEKGALPTDVSKSFGFEDLVKPKGFSMETAEEQQMKYNIALGNELARCIAAAPEISKAQVNIASSRDGFFGKEEATASVYIQPRTSEPVPEKKMRAICYLVAAAVGPKLPAKSVRVSNLVTGDSYSIDDGESAFSKASNVVELKRGCNKYYADEVGKFLSPFLGSVRVLVDTKVDSSTKSTKTTVWENLPEKSVTSTTVGEASSGAETQVQPNVGTSVVTSGTSAQPSKSEMTTKEMKGVPSVETATETPPGDIMDIGITVVADLARVESVIRANDKLKDTDAVTDARLNKEYERWKEMLKNGLPVSPNATITRVDFSAAPFATMELASAAPVAAQVKSGFAGAMSSVLANWHRVALAIFAIVALLMIRGLAKKAEVEAADREPPKEPEEEDLSLPEVELDIEQKRASKMRETIEDMIRTDPQTAVSLIRRWMARES